MESLHFLLMANHFLFQKNLLASAKKMGLTPGQPKILDFLSEHNGCVQKEIAFGCHIEPASAAVILRGMEDKGYIQRRSLGGDRRSLYVFLTDKGFDCASALSGKFESTEKLATKGLTDAETARLHELLSKVYENMKEYEKRKNEK